MKTRKHGPYATFAFDDASKNTRSQGNNAGLRGQGFTTVASTTSGPFFEDIREAIRDVYDFALQCD